VTRSVETTSRIMAAVRNRDTGPELALRKELHRRGLRYRLRAPLPGRPDLTFPGSRVAVFVDGDYWHGNMWRLRGAVSFEAYFDTHANPDFWRAKITRNIKRDRAVERELTMGDWRVLRVWESDLNRDLHGCADRVEAAVRENHSAAARGGKP
jgi:DNA mismatch endonuclease (patch repair protein)